MTLLNKNERKEHPTFTVLFPTSWS